MTEITAEQALAWRLERHLLHQNATSAEEVVGRLGVVGGWLGNPELAVARRLADRASDSLARAHRERRIMATWLFRGASHYVRPEDAGAYLAIRAASRQWETKKWRDQFGLGPDDWQDLRPRFRDVVAEGPATGPELARAVPQRLRSVTARVAAADHVMLKPFAWQGDICFGPQRDSAATFDSPARYRGWTGLPDLDVAGREVVSAYLRSYGPVSEANLHYWLCEGLTARRSQPRQWMPEVRTVMVDGSERWILPDDLAELQSAKIVDDVILLPGHDQWVMGPGTADPLVVPPGSRQRVSRGAGVALKHGVVRGTWRGSDGTEDVTWWP